MSDYFKSLHMALLDGMTRRVLTFFGGSIPEEVVDACAEALVNLAIEDNQ